MENIQKANIINVLENSKFAQCVYVAIILTVGLIIRVYFLPFDVPLFNDAQGYFWYAIDSSILNSIPVEYPTLNNGWPLLLSIIFQVTDSNNFLDFQNLQRISSMIISLATFFPVYFLCSKFFKKSYSLIGASLFILEPRLIINSLNGTPEAFYILLVALSIAAFLSNDSKKQYLSFAILGVLSLVRFEGFLILLPLTVLFFVRYRQNKKYYLRYLICIAIFVAILLPNVYLDNKSNENVQIIEHISAGPSFYQKSIDENNSSSINFLQNGISKTTMYFGWIVIPTFIIFLPAGIFFIFTKLEINKITIISIIIMILIPAFYAYSRDFSETKYLFALYPFLCLISCYSLKIFIEKFKRKNLVFVVIITAVIIGSVAYVEWKSLDNEHYQETFEILSEIKQMDVKINTDFGTCKNGCEFLYFHWLRINGEEEFPILKKDLPKINIGWLEQNIIEEGKELRERNSMYSEKMGITNINDYIFFLEKQKITHLLIDYENKSHDITNDLRIEFRNIFDDEKKFSYLDKEYDSVENGYNYHLKLFKIDYDKFKRQIELIP
ncbi:glycosyltransferase family 39 protein [Candidatus Nitrosopelagicus sp.]|nr:glycosyltransferase family 39 protein [Candidatus Nitrosopelagicus sp.]